MAALAARQSDLSATIAALPPLLRTTNSALTSLNASFGPTKTFAKEILPGVEQVDPTIGAGAAVARAGDGAGSGRASSAGSSRT